jgi:outer membrane autotransporter protein
MGKYGTFILAILFIGGSTTKAQTRSDKLYTVSGIGTSMPVGDAADVFGPKISTTLGVNLGLGNGGLFLYPKLSLHALSYRGKRADEGFTYTAQTGRATTYLLNVALGYRKMVGKFAFYGFAGGGGGYILTPRVQVDHAALQVKLSNETHFMPMLEGGAGTEFNLGSLAIFAEASYMNGFQKIQDRNFTTVPLTLGIKPNLSKLFNK